MHDTGQVNYNTNYNITYYKLITAILYLEYNNQITAIINIIHFRSPTVSVSTGSSSGAHLIYSQHKSFKVFHDYFAHDL
jgi:hypothetical protein